MIRNSDRSLMKVKVGSSWWHIIHTPGLKSEGADLLWGVCMPIEKEIRLTDGQQPEQELHTFFHEFLHAAGAEYGLNVLLGEDEEQVVDLYGMALCQALTQSPAMLKYINKQVKLSAGTSG